MRARHSWTSQARTRPPVLEPPRLLASSPELIARGVAKAVRAAGRPRRGEFRSAMSMLELYLSGGGRNLSAAQQDRLERAKDELRRAFGRLEEASARRRDGKRCRSSDSSRRGSRSSRRA